MNNHSTPQQAGFSGQRAEEFSFFPYLLGISGILIIGFGVFSYRALMKD